MNIEEHLRDAFAERAAGVEVTPGALFEIQRRLSRTGRLPELRLRPAIVLAAAACVAAAVVIPVTLTATDPEPPGQIATPVAGPGDPTAISPAAESAPATSDPQPPEPEVPPATQPPASDPGQITTVAPPTPPEVDPQPLSGAPEPPPAAAEGGSDTGPDQDTVTAMPQESPCPLEPTGSDNASTTWVTVYFACGGNDAAPRRRPVSVHDLATALDILLSGPDEADIAAGFRGLSANPTRTAAAAADNRWVTIDLPADLAGAFDTATGVTAAQFLTQLNATVFQFPDFVTAEYRLDGDCAAFAALVGQPCQVHLRDGNGFTSRTSELTAQMIGDTRSVIRAEPDNGAAEVGVLAGSARLTDRRTAGNTGMWAEVITTAGESGWVATDTLIAQPLTVSAGAIDTMVSLARQLTTGPFVEASAFRPDGLIIRWGAGPGDITVIPTTDSVAGGDWWYRSQDIPSPRDAEPTTSPADLLWIDGSNESAVVTINAPGPLGEPHSDFASLAYVSIYQAAVARSIVPPGLEPAAPTTTTEVTPTDDEDDLPPTMPGLIEPSDEEQGTSEPLRAQISVIFDFLSPGGPRIAAVEAIWIEPSSR